MTKKKDYIINLRLSRDVYDKLKERAKENSETLSELVRKSIDDGLEILEDVSDELFDGKKSTDPVESYHKGTIMVDTTCFKCKRKIKKGSDVVIGETKRGKKKYLCTKCSKK